VTTELDRYKKYGERIEALVRPATFPLAVKLIKSETEILPEYKRPSRDMALQNFLCQNFKMARSYGWTIAITEADINCKGARSVYGWEIPTAEEKKWAEEFIVGLYSRDSVTASKFEQHLYSLDNEFAGLIISPLTRTKIVPDSVLIYCLPAQAMRFVQGYLFMEGGVMEFSAAGRVGSCQLYLHCSASFLNLLSISSGSLTRRNPKILAFPVFDPAGGCRPGMRTSPLPSFLFLM